MSGIVNLSINSTLGTIGHHPNSYQMTDDFPFYSLYDAVAASGVTGRHRSTMQNLMCGFITANQHSFQPTDTGAIS